jgi:hypothetical protein
VVGDLHAKHPFSNSVLSKFSGAKLLNLLHANDFDILVQKYSSHYSHAGNGDVLNIIVHKNSRLSGRVSSEILDSDHLPIIFHLLHHIRGARGNVIA